MSEDGTGDDSVYQRNSVWVAPGEHSYNTDLGNQEPAFQEWVVKNKVPFDVSAPVSDYDMRGFWQGMQSGHPQAATAVNPNDRQLHFPDYWKTPYHESFSAESQWADPAKAPMWNDKDQLVLPDGSVIFDERKRAVERAYAKQQENTRQLQKLKGATK